ncbi:MAG: tetratricopeptide repeat protein [Clostridium sp.]|nr:tetratricopeptide repeat protein [Clostridium sp.]
MECYNCGCLLTENEFCTNCGADVRVYKKIISASNRYYNIGLERAGVRDLSGAAESLRQCLKLNKNHVEARNLLGLIYYETGEVVSALNEWVMSKNIKPLKNIADDYIEDIRSNPTQLDTLTQAVKKYNQALNYCMQDSVDLAVIQLKKVLSMNPKYLQAHQLLALIYMSQEDWDRAEKEVEKALRIDTSNTLTMRYMKEIDFAVSQEEGRNPSKKKSKDQNAKKYKSGNDTVIQPINNKDSRGLSTIINIIIGVLIGLAIAIFLILPAQIQTEVSKVNEQITEYSELLTRRAADVQEREAQIEDLNRKLAETQEALDAYTGTDGTIAAYEQLLEAVSLYMQEEPDVMAVADSLGKIDEDYVEEEAPDYFANVYHELLTLIGPDVSKSYYQTGMAEYNVQNYSEAVNYFLMAVSFDETDSMALYQLAESYYRSDDMENAAVYYNRVIELFPGRTSAINAQRRLREIEQQ